MAAHSGILAWGIPMDRGAWRATPLGVAKSQTKLKRMSMHADILNQIKRVSHLFAKSFTISEHRFLIKFY